MNDSVADARTATPSEVASEGGRARAESLSPEQRREIARKAAEARWSSEYPRATHEGAIKIGNTELPCYVLEDGERILSTRGVMKSIGRRWRGRKHSGTELPVFLEAKNLKPFIGQELDAVLNEVKFRTPKGARAEGFKAKLLPLLCEVYLRARDAGALTATQGGVAIQADILMRGMAQIGIIALVDEATGYQVVRDRMALQAILDKYLRTEFAAWAKRFPDEFYREIFRLRGWVWKGMRVNRPQIVAEYTKDLVYARLAPAILEELETRNPMQDNRRRKSAHHQWMTEDIGVPALAQHLHAVIALMRASPDKGWVNFKRMIDRALPKRGSSVQFDFDDLNLSE
jgi:hypothetical protein